MSGGDEITSLRLCIEGDVQGVGYRYFAVAEASRLKLDGWVRNRADGTVEALVSGPNAAVETFVGACMRGPSSARVRNVELHLAAPPDQRGFYLKPTY
jgi:acylphosphatase